MKRTINELESFLFPEKEKKETLLRNLRQLISEEEEEPVVVGKPWISPLISFFDKIEPGVAQHIKDAVFEAVEEPRGPKSPILITVEWEWDVRTVYAYWPSSKSLGLLVMRTLWCLRNLDGCGSNEWSVGYVIGSVVKAMLVSDECVDEEDIAAVKYFFNGAELGVLKTVSYNTDDSETGYDDEKTVYRYALYPFLCDFLFAYIS
jgi:hypothetical protein